MSAPWDQYHLRKRLRSGKLYDEPAVEFPVATVKRKKLLPDAFVTAKLPKEVLWKILDYLHPIKDKRTLGRCSLICKAMGDYLQEPLYHTVRIRLWAPEKRITFSPYSVEYIDLTKDPRTRTKMPPFVTRNRWPSSQELPQPTQLRRNHPLRKTKVLIIDHSKCYKLGFPRDRTWPETPSHSWIYDCPNLKNVETIYEEIEDNCEQFFSIHATIGNTTIRVGKVKKYVMRISSKKPTKGTFIHANMLPDSIKTYTYIYDPTTRLFSGDTAFWYPPYDGFVIRLVLWPFSNGKFRSSKGHEGRLEVADRGEEWYYSLQNTVSAFLSRATEQNGTCQVVGLQETWEANRDSWYTQEAGWEDNEWRVTETGSPDTFEELTRELLTYITRHPHQSEPKKVENVKFISMKEYLATDEWKDELDRDDVVEWLSGEKV